jgi:predicted metal-dependent phosphoesterase TrpH
MKIKYADLHIHTRYSDGTYRVPEVFRIAKKHGFSAVSITDHDSTDSYHEALELSVNYGIEIIPGVELSSEYNDYDIHILGYFMDPFNSKLIGYLKDFRTARAERAKKMTELLQDDGIDIRYEDILKISPDGAIARPHIAQLLIEKGHAYCIQDAFVKFLGTGSKYYVPKYKISPADAVELIHHSGGLAFAAHPFYLKDDPAVLDVLIDSGIDGIETIHSSYDKETAEYLDSLSKERGLLRSGGSDCHGKRKLGKKLMGQYFIPYSYIEAMKKKLSGETK